MLRCDACRVGRAEWILVDFDNIFCDRCATMAREGEGDEFRRLTPVEEKRHEEYEEELQRYGGGREEWY
jgi:hypothetical protein